MYSNVSVRSVLTIDRRLASAKGKANDDFITAK